MKAFLSMMLRHYSFFSLNLVCLRKKRKVLGIIEFPLYLKQTKEALGRNLDSNLEQ